MTKHTKKIDVRDVCKKWQKVLRLEDWNIDIDIRRYYLLEDARRAEIIFSVYKKEAIIHVLDPLDWDNEDDMSASDIERRMELSIVHELLHLHFAPLKSGKDADSEYIIAEEQAINIIASALVKLSL